MDAIQLLKNYKIKLDAELKKYFAEKLRQAEKNDPLAKEAIKVIANFTLAAGKRIRPALVYYGYLASGGKNKKKIIKASMGIELTHSFLLIHDDIIDRDALRHGIPTVHEVYKKIGRRFNLGKDEAHFGNSMAMMAGDMASAMANELIFECDFKPEITIRALNKLQAIVYRVAPGEMIDMMMEVKGRATEKEVLRMYEGKTSAYSFEGPLHLGALLAGEKNQRALENFSAYALPVGIAFQIRDDIIGLFGDEKKTGKPVGSDVIEGKQTLLMVKAKRLGSRAQREIIGKYLGKNDLKKNELEEVRRIVKESGALAYAEKLSEELTKKALTSLAGIKLKNHESEVFLKDLAEYMIRRDF